MKVEGGPCTGYNGVHVRCSSVLFDTLGILCQHALYVLKKKKVMELPEYYILDHRP